MIHYSIRNNSLLSLTDDNAPFVPFSANSGTVRDTYVFADLDDIFANPLGDKLLWSLLDDDISLELTKPKSSVGF